MSEHMPAAEPTGPVRAEKRVSWAELFFDLVFVFAVTQVSTLLSSGHGPAGLARAVVVFVPIYWVWVGTSIRANTRELTPRRQLALFAIALAGLIMALVVPDAYRDRALLFAAAYWAARLVLGSGLFTGTRTVFTVFTVSMVITGPLLIAGAVLGGRGQQWLWTSAAIIDLATPWVLQSQTRRLRVDAAHLAERFGLFVLIALGESVVAIGAPVAAGHRLVGAGALAAVAFAFAVCCGLWWVYFNTTADAVREALAAAGVQADLIREVLSYGHLLFIARSSAWRWDWARRSPIPTAARGGASPLCCSAAAPCTWRRSDTPAGGCPDSSPSRG
jgi:low temperature requirement protein LtrA